MQLRALGADEVVDYRSSDFADVLSGVDIVLDSRGGTNLEKSLTVLAPGGLAISVVGPPDPAFARQLGKPLLDPVMAALSARIRGRPESSVCATRSCSCAPTVPGSPKHSPPSTTPAPCDRTFPFDQTAAARTYVEQGQAKGKVVVTRSPTEA